MLPLTKEEIKCGKRILQKLVKNRNYQKVRYYTLDTLDIIQIS